MQHCGGADHGRPPPLATNSLNSKHKSSLADIARTAAFGHRTPPLRRGPRSHRPDLPVEINCRPGLVPDTGELLPGDPGYSVDSD
jgi:hypothetical protein